MTQRRTPAAFIRGGTSKGLFFDAADLPDDQAARNRLFLDGLGSPDPYGRQLDGMGGGISSLSKIVIVSPSSRTDADVDYLFGQIGVREAVVDYAANCGNLTSAVGPFAVEQGMISAPANGPVTVRLYNRNTDKRIDAQFTMQDGAVAVRGDVALTGVSGTGAEIALSFLDPGGAVTGRLLPTGNVCDILDVPDLGPVQASMVDATTAAVFVTAATVGLSATDQPDALDQRDGGRGLAPLEAIRRAAAIEMGLDPGVASVPKIGIVGPPAPATTLSGTSLSGTEMTLNARMVSMGNTHRALPLTGAMCLAAAARIPGSIVNGIADIPADGAVQIGTPSGILKVDARIETAPELAAAAVTVSRTQRRLMDGHLLTPHVSV